jgi:hypothetical protein
MTGGMTGGFTHQRYVPVGRLGRHVRRSPAPEGATQRRRRSPSAIEAKSWPWLSSSQVNCATEELGQIVDKVEVVEAEA